MSLLVLKLVVTPLLVGGSALVARRWGPSVGGWLIALPLTSGPVLVFVALEHGIAFARATAVGTLGGLTAIAAFCVSYAFVASAVRGGAAPVASLATAVAVYFGIGVALGPILGTSIWLVALVTLTAVLLAIRLVPASRLAHPRVAHPRWDLPARMIVATALVVGITTWAPLLGPHWSGVAATFPVYLAVLVAFTHQQAGPAAATDVLRGLLGGLFGTGAFYLVVDALLVPYGLGVALAAAVVTAMVIGAATLGGVRAATAPERTPAPAAGEVSPGPRVTSAARPGRQAGSGSQSAPE